MDGFDQAAQSLNLNGVLNLLAKNCRSDLGKSRVRNSHPFLSRRKLENYLTLLDEMIQLLMSGRLPLGPFIDIRVLLNQIEPIGSYLESKEILHVIGFLEISEAVRGYLSHLDNAFPNLQNEGTNLENQYELLNQLKFTVDPDGNIYDNASSDLKRIRKEIATLQQKVHDILERIARKQKEHLQESFTTLRDGRLVLPVREFSVSKIPGIVHGQSGSGSTKYVEPMPVVDINNNLQELFIAERRETIKILQRLSNLLRENKDSINHNLKALIHLDALQARALYAKANKAVIPRINNTVSWEIRDARHPLLLEKIGMQTVPLNLSLNDATHILVISGPNAGGKTVALKTVGILQLMLQCGIPLPVDPGSTFPFCEQVFVQIGDKQSLENDLSTFSSHVQGLRTILNKSHSNALILIDEIGIGTEPSGGAALAIAVLEQLNRPGLCTLVSTHQTQLKIFASENKGVLNAAMQYDIDQLKPLFILETGIPGSSFTFDICRRYGIPEKVLNRARAIEGSKQHKIESLLNEIASKSAGFHDRLNALSIKESKLNALTKLYNERVSDFRKKEKQMERDARRQAKEIIEQANRQIEATIREIKEAAAEKKKVISARKKLQDFKNKNFTALQSKHEETRTIAISEIKKGQRARSKAFNVIGRITQINKAKQEIVLEREGMRMSLSIHDVELISEDGQTLKQQPDYAASTEAVSSNLPNRLDLRGLDVQDALSELELYLDRIIHSQWREVTIVHGKGTGTLRKAVQSYMSKKQNRFEYRTGRYGEGDTGVTMVTILDNKPEQ